MKRILLWASLLSLAGRVVAAEPYADRWVWVFGWGLGRDSDVAEISRVLEAAGKHGMNGAVVSVGLDTLCKQSDDYFRRLELVKGICQTNGLELVPAIFSIGYGGGLLAHNPNLAEGLPVEGAEFVVKDGEAQLASGQINKLVNGGFEDFSGTRLKGFSFYDQPGEIGFIDTQIKHGGQASLRLENFRANPHGHGRVMQTVEVEPHRCYRMTLWVKTEGLEPAGSFQISVLTDKREVAPRRFKVPATTDWQKVSFLFNSLDERQLKLYAGVWGGKTGKFWLDDWSLEEVGPINALHRPGTPVRVCSADGLVTYSEGKDYVLQTPPLRPWRDDGEAARLKVLSGSRIQQRERLRVSWYHSAIVYESQVTVCMGEPEVYDIFDHEARSLAERLRPKRVLLNMDEIRMGGTCRACAGRNMGELLGECVTKQAQILHRHLPNAQVYVWSDMFDPTHNAHGNYYLVNGDFTGSWKHVPNDVVMALWSGEPREKSMRFLEAEGFQMLVACYYDADDLNQVKAWLQLARQSPSVRGFMYTPWEKKYSLLPEFGDLLNGGKTLKRLRR